MRLLLIFLEISFVMNGQNCFLFVGSYTQSGSKGIYVYRFDQNLGKLEWLSNTDSGSVVNPSFLCIAPNKKFIYACTDSKMPGEGSISAFAFDDKGGKLKFINKESSIGENPVYLSVHRSGKWLVNANYTAGNVTAHVIKEDGSVRPMNQIIQLEGSGPNKDRQEKAHAHAVVFSPMGEQLFVTDLGSDKIMIYNFNEYINLPMDPGLPSSISTVKGSGPRHFIFHPHEKFAYCIEELSGTVAVYSYANGRLDTVQRLLAHDKSAIAPFASADIHVSPDGLFLYASNRGTENNIAIFSINSETGKLKLIGYQSTFGEGPRNFVIDPSGKYLLVANVQSGNIVVFKRNKKSGLLKRIDFEIKIPAASCLQMMVID